MPRTSIPRTLGFSFLVALVSGVIVSTTTVWLAPRQLANLEQEQRENLLAMIEQQPGLEGFLKEVGAAGVQARVVNLQTGQIEPALDPAEFDQQAAAQNPATSVAIPEPQDIAGIKRRSPYATVYLIRDNHRIQMIILPIHGKGYGSTLRGFVGLGADANTIAALSFYDHEETPGLGARIDDPQWLAQWQGKRVRDTNGDVQIRVGRRQAGSEAPASVHQVDGLTGATYTSRGVQNLLRYWLGDHGYGRFLKGLRENPETVF